MHYLDEAFGILPTSLNLVDEVEGQKLYSSDELKMKYLSAIKKQKMLQPIMNNIEVLVRRGVISPCFISSGVIKYLFHKSFANEIDKMTMGFYHPVKNKVYIVMDNRTSFMVWMSNKKLSEVTIHELMHYAAQNERYIFTDAFSRMTETYYIEFFKLWRNITMNNREARQLYTFLYETFEWKTVNTSSVYKYGAKLEDVLMDSVSDDEERTQTVIDLVSNVKTFLMNPVSFMNSLQTSRKTREMVIALYKAYEYIGIKKPDTTPIQELVYPSEIASISSVKPSKEHYATVKTIS